MEWDERAQEQRLRADSLAGRASARRKRRPSYTRTDTAADSVESSIIDPTGEVLFATKEAGVNKVISINLAERFLDPWIGDMRPRYHKEMRWDIATPALEGR